MKIPITQSKAWQSLQTDLGEKSHHVSEKDFEYLAIEKQTPLGKYLFLPYGPQAKDGKAFKEALKSLNDLAKKLSAIFIRIEPTDPNFAKLLPKASKKVKDIDPAETWILNLPKEANDDPLNSPEFKALLPSRLLRYYKGMAKQGITIETSHVPEDIHYLLDLQKELAKVKHINTFSELYLKIELSQPFSTLYLLKQGKNILAAGLVFDDNTTRYNLQGAQSEAGRALHATGILTIQLIIDAAKKGLKTFDFWGIAPDGAPTSHPWYGFTAFKKTFAGREQKYAGTHDIILNLIKYKVYQFLRFINIKLRKH